MAKLVVCNSGGLDSALVAAKAQQDGHETHSLYVSLGQMADAEQEAAAATTAANFCASHRVIGIDIGRTPDYWQNARPDSADTSITWFDDVPPENHGDLKPEDHHTFPNLSMVVISLGIGYAKTIGATAVVTGHKAILTDSFIDQYNEVMEGNLYYSTKPSLQVPFWAYSTYAEVARDIYGDLNPTKIANLIAGYSYTHSCFWPTPCGVCGRCQERLSIGFPT